MTIDISEVMEGRIDRIMPVVLKVDSYPEIHVRTDKVFIKTKELIDGLWEHTDEFVIDVYDGTELDLIADYFDDEFGIDVVSITNTNLEEVEYEDR